jgi:hypothetical protein
MGPWKQRSAVHDFNLLLFSHVFDALIAFMQSSFSHVFRSFRHLPSEKMVRGFTVYVCFPVT